MWRSFDAIKEIVEQRKKLLDSTRDQSKANEILKQETENQRQASENYFQSKSEYDSNVEIVQRLENELLKATQARDESLNNYKENKKILDLANHKFNAISTELESVNSRVSSQKQKIIRDITDHYKGPQKLFINLNVEDDAENSSRVHALGDLHGWAPGLISYLTHHNLAKIEISGIKVFDSQDDGKISLNIDSMCELFPDLVDHLSISDGTENDVKRESFAHAGILGQPAGDLNLRSNYCNIDAEWIGADEFLFQIGDIFDRADHGEISAEILRQLIIQAPAHVFVLVGNHEEFLLCDQYNGWYRNEIKWDYNTKQQQGNTRNLDLLYPESTQEELFRDTYEKYKQSAAMLFLTQYFAKRKLSSNNYSDLPNLSEKDLEMYSSKILQGDWNGYSAASELHEKILKSATRDGVRFPGAFAMLATSNCVFMHAEPNGLSKYLSGLPSEAITKLRSPVKIGKREYLFDDLKIIQDDDSYRSANTELFWARGASTGYGSLDSKFAHLTPQIIKIFPGVRNIIHGHTPVPHEHAANKPHTYVGRIIGEDVTRQNGEIRVYNIDEGITPVYRNKMSITEKMNTIPIGLQLPKELQSLHESGELISVEEIWKMNSFFVERDSLPFTVGKELMILESPKQYAVNGPGRIEVNSKFEDKKYYAHTKEDEFRATPTEFSWLCIDKPENLTNPLEGRKPPPDGIYRVQTKNHGPITLIENLLNIVSISPLPIFGRIKIMNPFSDRKEVYKYVNQIVNQDKSWDKIVATSGTSELAACGGLFLTLRSTNDENILNFSIYNTGEEKTLIFSVRDDTRPSTLNIQTKSNQYTYGSWDTFNTESTVLISFRGKDGKSEEIFSAIFGISKTKPLFESTKIEQVMLSSNATKATESTGIGSVLEDETVRESKITYESVNNNLSKNVEAILNPNDLETNSIIDKSAVEAEAETESPMETEVDQQVESDGTAAKEAEAKEAEAKAAKEAADKAAKEAEAKAAKEAADKAAKEAEAKEAEAKAAKEAEAKAAKEAADKAAKEAEAKEAEAKAAKEAEAKAAKEAADKAAKEAEAKEAEAKEAADKTAKEAETESPGETEADQQVEPDKATIVFDEALQKQLTEAKELGQRMLNKDN